jgi:hypothetical protein
MARSAWAAVISGTETDKPAFTVADITHRALGPLRVVQLGSLKIRLTPIEAHTLALAMLAVRDGRSAETELFMSPIASDAIFVAPVGKDGIAVDTPDGPYPLAWPEVGALAAGLSPEAVAGATAPG